MSVLSNRASYCSRFSLAVLMDIKRETQRTDEDKLNENHSCYPARVCVCVCVSAHLHSSPQPPDTLTSPDARPSLNIVSSTHQNCTPLYNTNKRVDVEDGIGIREKPLVMNIIKMHQSFSFISVKLNPVVYENTFAVAV